MTISDTPTLTTIRATEIGEFIRHQSCERRFKLEINNRALARALPFAERLFNPLDPVLQEMGHAAEDQWAASLNASGFVALELADDQRYLEWDAFVAEVENLAPDQELYAREVRVANQLGAFHLEGRVDFALVIWVEGRPRLRVVECKASRKDRTYHRIQLAIYGLIIRQRLQHAPIQIGGHLITADDVECMVARIDEATNTIQPLLELLPLNLEMEEADVWQLLAENGLLAQIVTSDLDTLDYQLDSKCDGCVFSVHCFPESARQRRLELLGLEPSATRALRQAGVQTIDDLAVLDLDSQQALQIQASATLMYNLRRLKELALTRRATLPHGEDEPDNVNVRSLPYSAQSQLPEHTIDGDRLTRIYLAVHYDYTENRIAAVSAHVTASDGHLHTGFIRTEDRTRPDPQVRERRETGRDAATNRAVYQEQPLSGRDIVVIQPTPWTGRYDDDAAAERELLHRFFTELTAAIIAVAPANLSPLHFYVWSRSDLTQLIEGCSRADTQLLRHLQELLGCREGLEQLIYSCIQDEVDRRYALGWTGRGLSVVTSLRWFGQSFHWVRDVDRASAQLDRVFTQDIFDFKTDLDLRSPTEWAETGDDATSHHKFEIRSRFFDSISAPYWRAYWGTLPDPTAPGVTNLVANAIRRYNQAAGPSILPAYLRARTQALRWVEERITFKNRDIRKPSLDIAALSSFTLGVDTPAQAAIDFLRLDQHVKVNDWVARNLKPPVDRIPLGRTIPLQNVRQIDRETLQAEMYLGPFGVSLDVLESICAFKEGDFVRVTIWSGDPDRGQTVGQLLRFGATSTIEQIDWQTGTVVLSVIGGRGSQYILSSQPIEQPFATLDESVSDFVATRVDKRLTNGQGNIITPWFDRQNPVIPARLPMSDATYIQYQALLAMLRPGGYALALDQQQAILAGLNSTIQLLQGPPGTGKTTTTAVAVLLRAMAATAPGGVILLGANTHTAVDTLLKRIERYLDEVASGARDASLSTPRIQLAKVFSSDHETLGQHIESINADQAPSWFSRRPSRYVTIIGGTTSALLKMVEKINTRPPYNRQPDGLQVSTLVVDEASMMVFPHFLSLATLVTPDGQIMLTGDHRQLSPIIAHDWEREDRPPVVLYQPYVSSYNAVLNIKQHPHISDAQVLRSALRFTFRLPPIIRDLVARLYRLDNIELEGQAPTIPNELLPHTGDAWERVWEGQTGLYLITHSERQSKQRNEVEITIIETILARRADLAEDSVAIITPHRAQRSLLQLRLAENPAVGLIDTVERLQGGERPIIMVSATASDPAAIAARAEFILGLNRSNVAFTRTQERLIVICSETLLNHIPSDVEHYAEAMLWKSLRTLCEQQVATEQVDGHIIRIFTPNLE